MESFGVSGVHSLVDDVAGLRCTDASFCPGPRDGAILSKARSLTDSVIVARVQRFVSCSPALIDPDDALLPDFRDLPIASQL